MSFSGERLAPSPPPGGLEEQAGPQEQLREVAPPAQLAGAARLDSGSDGQTEPSPSTPRPGPGARLPQTDSRDL